MNKCRRKIALIVARSATSMLYDEGNVPFFIKLKRNFR